VTERVSPSKRIGGDRWCAGRNGHARTGAVPRAGAEGVSARQQEGEDSTVERGAEADALGSQGADPKAGTSGQAEAVEAQARRQLWGRRPNDPGRGLGVIRLCLRTAAGSCS